MVKDSNFLVIGFKRNPPAYFTEEITDNKKRSGVWKYYHAIRETATSKEVENWYKCMEPDCKDPYEHCDVANGNATLRRHLKTNHQIIVQSLCQLKTTLTLPSNTLFEMLSTVSNLGERYGTIDEEVFQSQTLVPSAENWRDFLENVENDLKETRSKTELDVLMPEDRTSGRLSSARIDEPSCSAQIPQRNPDGINLAISMSADAFARIDLRSKSFCLHLLIKWQF